MDDFGQCKWTKGLRLVSAGHQVRPTGREWSASTLIWLGTSLVVLLSTAMAGCFGLNMEVGTLQAGDRVSTRLGIAITVPPGASGSYTEYARNDTTEFGKVQGAEEFLVSTDGASDHGNIVIQGYWPSETDVGGLRLVRGQTLVAATPDGAVEVRWTGPRHVPTSVWVVFRLAGKHPGFMVAERSNAKTAAAAYREAVRLWRYLSVEGAELPPRPGD